ncbi:MAG: SDR family NAD(P)-dependent oxidoreductase [Acidimicrobiales bacterium]
MADSDASLDGRRILVVGASSGIGRALAVAAAAAGAVVALAARRDRLVVAAAAEAGPTAVALACDVTDAAAAGALADDAAAALDGLDAVVYAAGTSPLGSLETTSAATWRSVLATNVVGAALVAAGALRHLRDGRHPTVALLSSHSVARPWPGLVHYAASKAALDELALGLRAEEPWLRVVRVVVGPTITGFADGWDPGASATAFERWAADGYLVHHPLEPAEGARRILVALGDPGGPDDVEVIGATTG